jgi:uncharacterized protein (DUF433 family)
MYSLAEAARYLDVPIATLRYWVRGARYRTAAGSRSARPIIHTPRAGWLSFQNLVEAHVLCALRRTHRVSLHRIRAGVDYLRRKLGSHRPLLEEQLSTDGLDLFVEKMGALLNVSREGQIALREVLEAYLSRIERDRNGAPIRLYPYGSQRDPAAPKAIVIDPEVQFGRPVLVGSGIPVDVVAGRFKAGDSIDQLADDYGRTTSEIQEALRTVVQVDEAA